MREFGDDFSCTCIVSTGVKLPQAGLPALFSFSAALRLQFVLVYASSVIRRHQWLALSSGYFGNPRDGITDFLLVGKLVYLETCCFFQRASDNRSVRQRRCSCWMASRCIGHLAVET